MTRETTGTVGNARRTAVAALAVAVATTAWTGCGGDSDWVFDAGQTRTGTVELAGLWAGEVRIGPEDAPATSGRVRDRDQPDYSFPVALELREDHRFRLISFGYPPAGTQMVGESDCHGIYSTRGGRVSFFPSAPCAALPLSSYRIGGSFDRLQLEGATDATGLRQAGAEVGSIRVRLLLSRVDRIPGAAEWDD